MKGRNERGDVAGGDTKWMDGWMNNLNIIIDDDVDEDEDDMPGSCLRLHNVNVLVISGNSYRNLFRVSDFFVLSSIVN